MSFLMIKTDDKYIYILSRETQAKILIKDAMDGNLKKLLEEFEK